MRNAGGDLTISTPYQASSRVQHFAVPLPPPSGAPVNQGMIAPGNHVDFRFAARSTTPGGGYRRSMTAPTREATSYQEIPTDGTAVLGMTKFLVVATIFHFLPVRFREGQDPPLHWPSFLFVAGDDTKIVNFPWGIFGANSFGLLSMAGHAII